MTVYSWEFKTALVAKLLPPNNEPLSKVASEAGISESTLRKWKRMYTSEGFDPESLNAVQKLSSEDKFRIVLETAAMNEQELGEYCREKGIYKEEIELWKEMCMKANGESNMMTAKLDKELKDKERELKEVKKELQRKEKALAETAAILTLRKKAAAIWGDEED